MAVIISYVLAFGLFAVIIWLLEQEIRHRRQAKAIGHQTKANLEPLVQNRMAELAQTNCLLQAEIQERKQQESQLRLLESVVRATNDAVVITEAEPIDKPGPRIVYVNPAFTEMTGYTSEEALGQTPRILQGEQTDRVVLDQIRAALSTWQPVRVDLVNYRKDGAAFWVELSITPVADEKGWFTHWVAVQRDITDRKQAELALQQAKTELEQRVAERTAELQQRANEIQDLYNKAPCGYHSLDAEGRFVRVNDTELRWLGYERDQLLGKRFADLLPPQHLPLFQESFEQFKQRGWANNLEFELICRDGSILSINLNATAIYDAAGNYLMSRSTLFDLRDRKQIEAALRQSEAKFRSLSESSPNGVWMTDTQGQTLYTNPRAQEICGYSFAEALGIGWTQFIHPDDLLPFFAQWERATVLSQNRCQNPVFDEVRYVHKDGSIRYGQIKLAPLLDANNQLTGYVGTIEDTTEQRQIENMKNEFVSIVSHELRTPLTAIRGSLGLLANGVYDRKPEKGKQMLQLALTQTERLVRLVSDILDLKRLESGQVPLIKQSCEAATLLTQSAETMQALAQQNHITLSVTPLSVPVWAAPDAITQTLTNLISNAIKFSPAGSTIWLSAERVENEWENQKINEFIPPSTPHIRFAIKDQGRGIPSDKIETIFGQFQQVDASDSRQKGGTGLGLAICRSIVQQHGGQIWVESVLTEGSTFYFTLPTSPTSRGCS